MPSANDLRLISDLSGRIDAALGGLLERGSDVALVNYPNIGNLGDAVIWLGARAALDRIGVRVVHRCEPRAYRRKVVRRAVGERGTILLQGGGNLGDLYGKAGQQKVRERVLRDFPRARVIQLPQSIWFRRERPKRRFAELCAAHEDFTLIVRDRASVERARELGLEPVLCPDLAFALGPLERTAEPSSDIFWLARTGAEVLHGELPELAPGVRVGDYPHGRAQRAGGAGQGLRALLAANRALAAAIERQPRLAVPVARPAAALYEPIARRRVELARRIVARGRVLITDRFHGHVLAALTGIPNVVLDNVYGKNRTLWETWTGRFESAHWADDPTAAQELALRLARGDAQVASEPEIGDTVAG